MKHIVKNFNNYVKKTIFKVQNKTNNNFKISNFNKYLITFISLLFLYLFYLLIPLFYEKNWIQASIKSRLLNEFKINMSTFENISYRILPAPHFLIKDSKIAINGAEKQKLIADIKDLKIFISQKNFFNKEKMNIKKVVIKDANFSLSRNDLKIINKLKNENFPNKKIKINNSNIFLKNNLEEVIAIVKIDKTIIFFDGGELLNFLNLNGEVFNIPFNFEFRNQSNPTKYEVVNLNSESLKLNIFNKYAAKENKSISGENIISFLNSTIKTKYDIKEKLIIFESENSRINNSQINYSGKLSINPFELDLIIYLYNHKISNLFNVNPILAEFIKSELLFNDNISIDTSITVNSKLKNEIFQKAKINIYAANGKINFNDTRFVNDEIGSIVLKNSNFIYQNSNLILRTDILIDIKNSDNLFSFLNTNKSFRKNLKNIFINLDYDFLSNQIKFNNVKIDNIEVSEKLIAIVEGFNDNNNNNFNKSRRIINDLLEAAYEG